jgi:HEAT repeat protein
LADRALGAATVNERQKAAIELSRRGKDAAEQMRRVFGQSTTPEVKAAAAEGLGCLLDVDSLPALIDAMEDGSLLVRGRAGVAVSRIVGGDAGFRANGPLKERQEAVAKYRKFWQEVQSPQSHFIEYMKDPEKARARAEAMKARAEATVAEMRKNQRTEEEKTNAPK